MHVLQAVLLKLFPEWCLDLHLSICTKLKTELEKVWTCNLKKIFYNFKHVNYFMNDKSIIELGYRKILHDLSVPRYQLFSGK